MKNIGGETAALSQKGPLLWAFHAGEFVSTSPFGYSQKLYSSTPTTKSGIEPDSILHFILSMFSELPTTTGLRKSITKEKETET